MPPKKFAKESDLCSTFLGMVDAKIWTPYAETAGWDILLVRKVDGYQIGIQAKLSLNLDVINQTLEYHSHWMHALEGPDVRAVLIPEGPTGKLGGICQYLGLVVFQMQSPAWHSKVNFHPWLPGDPSKEPHFPEWCPVRRHPLPEYVPDVVAGSPSPVQLTEWKIKAIKLCILMHKNGSVTRADFEHLKLDPRRWVSDRWIISSGKRTFVAGKMPEVEKQHPKVFKQIKSEFDKWAPPKQGKQGELI